MTKHEVDVIGGLNMTDQISNEAYKQIMIAAQDENEVGDVLDKIIAELTEEKESYEKVGNWKKAYGFEKSIEIIEQYVKGENE